MMWLQPIKDLLGELVLKCRPFHLGLLGEYFRDEHLCEASLEGRVVLRRHRHVALKFDLGAARRLAVLPWRLVAMTHVHPEHELVADLVKIGDVLTELRVRGLQHIGELDFDQLVELLGALGPV